jgi:hypothetical protein
MIPLETKATAIAELARPALRLVDEGGIVHPQFADGRLQMSKSAVLIG